MYVNGILENTHENAHSGLFPTDIDIGIIGNYESHDVGFDGIIDEISIHDHVLTANEIVEICRNIHVEQDEFGGSWFDGFEDASGITDDENLVEKGGVIRLSTHPVEEWNMTYGGNDCEIGSSLAQTSDGGYVITGFTESYGPRVGWLVKTDADGNELWNKTYDGSYDGKSIIEDSNGDYVAVGQKDVGGGNQNDVWLMKTDNNGNKLWEKTHGDTHHDAGNSIRQTKDGGYVVVGYGDDNDILLLKTDASGKKQWIEYFGEDELDMGESVITTSDGGYLVVGSIPYGGIGHDNVSVIKTGASGDKQWEKRFGGKETCDRGYSAVECSSGGYIITGYTQQYGGNNLWLIRIDNSGNEIWNRTYDGGTSASVYSVVENSCGEYLVAGGTQSYGSGNMDVWLIRTDSTGNELWNDTIGSNDYDIANCMVETSDGGYALAGQTKSYGMGNFDTWLVKCKDQFYDQGSMKSVPIEISDHMLWSSLSTSKTEPVNTYINISVIDAATNRTIPGLDNVTTRDIDLSPLNDFGITTIRLKAYFLGNGTVTPTLDSWGVEWIAENAWRDGFVGDSKLAYPYGVDQHTVGYWKFDEGCGNVASDLSGNGNDGTIRGANWTDGVMGKALEFDGKDDYVELGNDPSLDVATDFTFEAWFEPSSIHSAANNIICREGNDGIRFYIDGSDNNYFKTGVMNGPTYSSNYTINIRQFYHVAVTRDSFNDWKIFIDGNLVMTVNSLEDISNPNHPFTLATDFHTGKGHDYFNGLIDEVAIHNRTLTPSEILAHSRLYRLNATLRSVPITPPHGHTWSNLHFSRSVPENTYLNITAHDADTGEILASAHGFENELTVDLSSIDANEHPSIYLEARFRSNRTKTPVLYDWAVSWNELIPPALIEDIDTLFIDEDVPQDNLLDLSSYFHDPYSGIEPQRYALEYVSDEDKITLAINGSFLNVVRLAENWTGNVEVIVNCTNTYGLTVSSNMFKIEVSNVNDAPQSVLKWPVNGAVLESTDVTFGWQGIDVDTNLASVEYNLFFDDSESPELYNDNISVSNITITGLENGKTYYWYVIPKDPNLVGICLNGTWNFTIDTGIIDTEVILQSPHDGSIVNPDEVNLTWTVLKIREESTLYHVYLGQNEYVFKEIGTTENTWYTLSGLENGTTYYWYVIPSVGASDGICSSGIWHFEVGCPFVMCYDIIAESDVDRLEISLGNGTEFNIKLTNIGNALTTVSLTPKGPISTFVNLTRNHSLPVLTNKTFPVTIYPILDLSIGSYELIIEISHPGGNEAITIQVIITSWKPAEGDDDTDEDNPDGSDNSKTLWGDNQFLFVLDIIVVFVIASMVILLVVKRRRKKSPPEVDHYPSESVPMPQTAAVPISAGGMYPQNVTDYQYQYQSSPSVQQAEPVYREETFYPQTEPTSDHQPAVTQDYPAAGFQQMPIDPEPSPQVGEESRALLFTTYESIQCGICLGYIKTGAKAFLCRCGKTYHPTCAARVGKCPVCETVISREEVGIEEEEAPPEVSRQDEDAKVSWGAEPRIVGVDEDFSISDIFLINIDGLLIKSLSFGTSVREDTDEDIMTGMLTAITAFIRDSFRDEMGGLKTLQYGRMTIYLERGVTFYLVAVFRGEPPEDLRKMMRFALIQLWERYKHRLKVWDGTHDGLEGIENDILEHLGLELPSSPPPMGDDDYQPPKFTGEILTADPGEGEMPQVVTTVDVTTPQGCFHLYNMLLAKKGSDIRIDGGSSRSEIGKARKQIIMMYHPDLWQGAERANFFMKKVNVAWEVLSGNG